MENYKTKLLSKNGIAIISLARELLLLDPGYRIRTVGQLSDAFGLGRGTIQQGLRFLQAEGAVRLESRGHLGTFIVSIDYKRLWLMADIGTVTGVMPLPYTKRYEGLATGLYKSFEDADIPFGLAFMRGASRRIEALREGRYSFAVMSKLAAALEIRNADIEIAYEFPQRSYVANHVVILGDTNADRIKSGMKVGIDPDSIDQFLLTCYECDGLPVDYVEMSYGQILNRIKNKEIDAAVWSGDELKERNIEYGVTPLRNSKAKAIGRDDTQAVIVTNKDDKFIKGVLNKFSDMDQVMVLQQQVMEGKVLPTY